MQGTVKSTEQSVFSQVPTQCLCICTCTWAELIPLLEGMYLVNFIIARPFLTRFTRNGWALNILVGNLPNLQKVNKELPFSYYMPYETVTGFYEKRAPFHYLQTVPCSFVF